MFITNSIKKHGMETTRVLAGHKKSRTTELYNHLTFDEHMKKFYGGEKKKKTKEQ